VPARLVPGLVRKLLDAFRASPRYPDFRSFASEDAPALVARASCGVDDVEAKDDQAKDVQTGEGTVDAMRIAPDLSRDWGASEPFSLEGRGPGECGAGVFDLIEVDLATARDALAQGRLDETVSAAARALLVTRGAQASDDRSARYLFEKLFIREGLVEPEYLAPLRDAGAPGAARDFLDRVVRLYASMDDSLRFPQAASASEPVQQAGCSDGRTSKDSGTEVPRGGTAGSVGGGTAVEGTGSVPAADRDLDLAGVVCPLNYVKTKMALQGMAPGSVLRVVLDDAGARNVPESVSKDGHQVLSLEHSGGRWHLLVRRK